MLIQEQIIEYINNCGIREKKDFIKDLKQIIKDFEE